MFVPDPETSGEETKVRTQISKTLRPTSSPHDKISYTRSPIPLFTDSDTSRNSRPFATLRTSFDLNNSLQIYLIARRHHASDPLTRCSEYARFLFNSSTANDINRKKRSRPLNGYDKLGRQGFSIWVGLVWFIENGKFKCIQDII